MPAWLSRLWIQMTADRRRFAALCLLCAVGLLLWARIIVISNLPKTAVAEDEEETSAPEQNGDPNPHRSGLGSPVDAPPPLTSLEPPISVSLDAHPKRDPFVISPTHFPKPVIDEQTIADRSKSAAQAVEDAQTAEARITKHLQDLVGQLSLEAVLSGGDLVFINGRMYRRGESVPGDQGQVRFLLTEVKQRSVVLECQGRRFELKMPEPGK